MNSYDLSRNWFDWCFENPDKINPNHSALYFFCIEHCNRLGWKQKFGLPTTMVKEAIGIRSYNTYIKTLNDLISFGFIEMIEKSKNQYSSNIIALSKINKAPNKALDKALIKHSTKQVESIVQSIDSINKQGTRNKEQINILFEDFWNLYPVERHTKKSLCINYWKKLTDEKRQFIIDNLKNYISSASEVKYLKQTYYFFKEKKYDDDNFVIENTPQQKEKVFISGIEVVGYKEYGKPIFKHPG